MPSLERSREPAARLKLIIAYDGAPFQGWQSQAGGNTVQDRLEGAFESILGIPVSVQGSGRTDAGAHALGQCAHADVPSTRMNAEGWMRALNANMPPQIRVLRCAEASPKFHARFDAVGKIYKYRIWNASAHMPLEIGRSWHFPRPLSLKTLQSAASMLTGTHDFAPFAARRDKRPLDTVQNNLEDTRRCHGSSDNVNIQGQWFSLQDGALDDRNNGSMRGRAGGAALDRNTPRWSAPRRRIGGCRRHDLTLKDELRGASRGIVSGSGSLLIPETKKARVPSRLFLKLTLPLRAQGRWRTAWRSSRREARNRRSIGRQVGRETKRSRHKRCSGWQ